MALNQFLTLFCLRFIYFFVFWLKSPWHHKIPGLQNLNRISKWQKTAAP